MNIIFDFDGTIADSSDTSTRFFYRLTAKQQRLAEKVPFLMVRERMHMARRMKHIDAQPGLPDVIRKLHDNGFRLFIVSSNSQRNIQTFLYQHHMSDDFEAIYGGVGLFGKAHALKKVLRQNNLEPRETYYVSDEARDITAAHAAAMPVVAVTWGFNAAESLRKRRPAQLVDTPEQLLDLLQ